MIQKTQLVNRGHVELLAPFQLILKLAWYLFLVAMQHA